MKHKTWFRLVLRAIGLLLIGLGVPDIIAPVLSLVGQFIAGANWVGWGYEWYYVGHAIGGMFQVGLGLYLLTGGKLIINAFIPSNRPYCPDCGYDVANSRGERCPECGVTLPRERRESRAFSSNV